MQKIKKERTEAIKFGQELKQLRLRRGFSTYSVYTALKISKQALNAYECGRRCMKQNRLFELCSVLKLNPTEIEKLYILYSAAHQEAYSTFSDAAKARHQREKLA